MEKLILLQRSSGDLEQGKRSGTSGHYLFTTVSNTSSQVHSLPCVCTFVLLMIFSSTGRDFNPDIVLPITAQVDKLILQATSLENLCQCFSGW